ncbi:inorganic phosphate transporter [Fischerella thermalis WC246]|nr:inorganic phosphate transporter [Fischerella thermalis WC114]PLZ12119.1 inorganic phosphate transporter [Fischerella thermalis WC119]PLZ18458.1 inorganic phosphate transporter [Fischerella thermalis WC1110]PLZ24929.1 inorganic phosphate transporter [Fischerella thermalis WC157]PLZ42395.1 inorganic phosphate transporter [Fischerella thermalis WC527]PLZ44282.1 inorganic phosphate transporter [Fischerella thermalis WC538]PLZ67970.1 inorganic phosphate transporter [Fischerella thermalis WC344]
MFIVILLAFYLAFNLGANDVANAMGTSVGSKAVTLKQALIIAGVLEFTGAILFGHEVSETLATKIANPNLFAGTPQMLMNGMITVLISCGLWLQIATSRGLPVSSSHAVVGAIAGFSWVALGVDAIDWSSIGKITLGWIVTPVISGAIAGLFYGQIKRWILTQPHQLLQMNEWIPWLSAMLLGIFGVIVLPSVTQPLANFLIEEVGVKIPTHDISLCVGGIAAVGLSLYSWRELERRSEGHGGQGEMVNNQLPTVERLFAKFQLLSACFVAFAHGSNDVGNAIAPLAAIVYIHNTGTVPIGGIAIPIWILVLGGAGIVAGLAIWGKKVIATIGESIISLQPSSGFCAELATASTILLASRLGLPVSTSHALVGGVVGVGLVQNPKSVQFKTLQGIATAWLVTVPVSAGLSAVIFSIARIL